MLTLFDCQCISRESSNWGRCFYVSYSRRDGYYTWLSEPRECLAVCRAKRVLSFLRYFNIWSGPGNWIRDLPLCNQALCRLSYACCSLYLFIYFYLFFFSGNRKPVQDVWFVDEPIVVQYYSSGSIVSFLRSHVWSVGLQTKGTIS